MAQDPPILEDATGGTSEDKGQQQRTWPRPERSAPRISDRTAPPIGRAFFGDGGLGGRREQIMGMAANTPIGDGEDSPHRSLRRRSQPTRPVMGRVVRDLGGQRRLGIDRMSNEDEQQDGAEAESAAPYQSGDGAKELQKAARTLTPAELGDLEKKLRRKAGVDELRAFLSEDLGLNQEFIDFLASKSEGKMREALADYVAFDLKYGTRTTVFVTELWLAEYASQHPELFADPDSAQHTVRHRPSRTASITSGLEHAEAILNNRYGIDPSNAVLTDLGCGSGKVLAIAGSNTGDFVKGGGNGILSFHFQRVVGVDLFAPFLRIAAETVQAPALELDIEGDHSEFLASDDAFTAENPRLDMTTQRGGTLSLVWADAAAYDGYRGSSCNVVWMYNPFDETVVREVEFQLRSSGSAALVVYNKPKHRDVFERKGWEVEHDEVSDADPDKQLVILSYRLAEKKPRREPVQQTLFDTDFTDQGEVLPQEASGEELPEREGPLPPPPAGPGAPEPGEN